MTVFIHWSGERRKSRGGSGGENVEDDEEAEKGKKKTEWKMGRGVVKCM